MSTIWTEYISNSPHEVLLVCFIKDWMPERLAGKYNRSDLSTSQQLQFPILPPTPSCRKHAMVKGVRKLYQNIKIGQRKKRIFSPFSLLPSVAAQDCYHHFQSLKFTVSTDSHDYTYTSTDDEVRVILKLTC